MFFPKLGFTSTGQTPSILVMIYPTHRKGYSVFATVLRFTRNRKKKTHVRTQSGVTYCFPKKTSQEGSLEERASWD